MDLTFSGTKLGYGKDLKIGIGIIETYSWQNEF